MPRKQRHNKKQKSPNPPSKDSKNESNNEDEINFEIIHESKQKPLQITIAALLMKTKSLEVGDRRKFVLNSVIQPRFMQFYFKSKYYKSKKDQKKRNSSKVTPRLVTEYVDKFVVEKFCNSNSSQMPMNQPTVPSKVVLEVKNEESKVEELKMEELKMEQVVEHPKGVEFNFEEEMRRMRENEEIQREQEEEEWMTAEMERRANSNCCVRFFRAIKEWLEDHITTESFCLVILNVIMVALLAYAIQLLVIRFQFFADDIDHIVHVTTEEAQDNIQIPVVD